MCLTTAAPLRAQSDYVRRLGGQLVVDTAGTPYYYVGAQMWYAPLLGCKKAPGDRKRLAAELDSLQRIGVDCVTVLAGARVEADGTGAFRRTTCHTDEALLQGLDYALAQIQKRGLRAVVCLADSMPRTDEERARFDAFLTALLNRKNTVTRRRYADDASIQAWQLCQALVCPREMADDAFVGWVAQAAGAVKALDAHHLVSAGSVGIEGTKGNASLYEDLTNLDALDVLSLQVFPLERGWITRGSVLSGLAVAYLRYDETLARYERLARRADKPLLIEGFGYPRDHCFTRPGTECASRNDFFAHVLRSLARSREQGGAFSGCTFFGWGGTVDPGDELDWHPDREFVAEAPEAKQGVYSVFAGDGTIRQKKPLP